jgi:hypothetical protein
MGNAAFFAKFGFVNRNLEGFYQGEEIPKIIFDLQSLSPTHNLG